MEIPGLDVFLFCVNPPGEAKAHAGGEEALHDTGVQRAELHQREWSSHLQAFSRRSMPKGESEINKG